MSPSAKLVPVVPLEQLETASLVDLLGPIEEELDRIAALVDPSERQAKKIREILSKRVKEPDATVLRGKDFFANVGERNMTTMPKCASIFKTLGRAEFLAHCEFGVEKLKTLLPDWQKFVDQARTGSRKVVSRRYPKTQGIEVKIA